MVIQKNGRVKKTGQYLARKIFPRRLSTAKGDQRVVMRPHRAVMIGHWIVTFLRACNRTNSPARKEPLREKYFHPLQSPFLIGDTGEEAMAGIRACHPALTLVFI